MQLDGGTISIVAARPAIEELDRRRIDLAPVLAEAHLSPSALTAHEARFPYRAVVDLWEAASHAASDPHFGAHVASTLPVGGFDVFDYIFSTAETVGEGLERALQYIRLVYDHSNVHLHIDSHRARLYRRNPGLSTQYNEFALTLIVVRIRQSTGIDWTPERVRFEHAGVDAGGELERLFRCPIVYGAPDTELVFDPKILSVRHARPDSRLLAILMRYADSLLTTLPKRNDLVGTVSATIARQMVKELPTLAATATAVELPERTLQRRLATRGTSHSDLVDQVRRDLALRYILDAGRSVGEIAYLLHFSDSTAFHRAFKRWTGEGPAQYRRGLFRHPPS